MAELQPFDEGDRPRPAQSSPPPPPPPPVSAPGPTPGPAQVHQGGGAVLQTDQRPQSGAVVGLAWVIAVFTFFYMLPWAVAVTRGRSNQAAIGLLNFFLGWSLVGWIVSLVMAVQAHQVVGTGTAAVAATQISITQPGPETPVPPGWYPAPDGQARQYWDGRQWTSHRAP